MRRVMFLIILALSFSACKPAAPIPSPTLLPTAAATITAVTGVTPTSDSNPAATASPLPAGQQEFIFPHFENLRVAYPSAAWQSDKGLGQGWLVNKTIQGCEISDSYPDAPPEPKLPSRLGSLDYQVSRKQTAAGLAVNWFFPPAGLDPAAPENAEPVILVVTSPAAQESICLEAAGKVLATLSPSGIP